MSTTPGAAIITAEYRAALKLQAQGAARVISQAYSQVNPGNIDASFQRLLPQVSAVITGGQGKAADLSHTYLRRFVSAELGIAESALGMPDVARSVVGTTVTGSSVPHALGWQPVYAKHLITARRAPSDGYQALAMSLSSTQSLARSELFRAAQVSMREMAAQMPDVEGYQRIASAGACKFCVTLVGRGAVYRLETVGFRAHLNCGCTAEPVVKVGAATGTPTTTPTTTPEQSPTLTLPTAPYDYAEALHITSTERLYEQFARAAMRVNMSKAPRAASTLRGVAVVRQKDMVSKRACAYYQPDKAHITIRQSEFTWSGENLKDAAQKSGWWTPRGDASAARSTLTHEFGHHVDFTLTVDQRDGVFEELARALGARAPETTKGVETRLVGAGLDLTDSSTVARVSRMLSQTAQSKRLDAWVVLNKRALMREASEYGVTNARELLAELWAEYVLNSHPRPLALKVGAAMARYMR